MGTISGYLIKVALKEPERHFNYYGGDFKELIKSLPESFGFRKGEIDIKTLGEEKCGKYKLCLKADEKLGDNLKEYLRCGKNILGLIEALEPYYDPSCRKPLISIIEQ